MNTQLMIAGYCPVGNYSFEIIYKKYHTFFVHYAEKTMGEELYAEDVVQDVFINLLQQTCIGRCSIEIHLQSAL